MLALLGSLAAYAYVVAFPQPRQPFTEFYFLGADGSAANYPRQLGVNEETSIIVGIIDREYQNVTYQVVINIDGVLYKTLPPVELSHEQKYEHNVAISFAAPGAVREVTFLLYRLPDETEACRTLRWRVEVVP